MNAAKVESVTAATHAAEVPAHAAGRIAPSPPERGLLGHLGPIRSDELSFLLDTARRCGGVARLRFGHLPAHVISAPEGVRRVLLDNVDNYDKHSRGYRKMRQFLGNGLLTSEGEFWRRQRRIAQPSFHHRRVAGFGEAFVRHTDELVDGWVARPDPSEPLDVAGEMMHLTLRIVGETLLSTDLTRDAQEVGDALSTALKEIDRRVANPFPFLELLPTPRNLAYQRACRTLDRVVRRLIGQRRALASTERPQDLLTMLMEAQDEETGESMSDDQLRDELLTIMLAGHETTANSLSWTLYLLSKHPLVRRRLESELEDVLGDRSPTAADYPSLVFTRQVLQESLRLYPPAWFISRRARQADQILGFDIPADSMVFVSPWVTHRLPEIWPNPEGFDPDRFAGGKTPPTTSFEWFPFGGGSRVCIGKGFAMMESVLVLATMLRRVRADMVQGWPVELEPVVTLRPRHGLGMTVRPRRGQEAPRVTGT